MYLQLITQRSVKLELTINIENEQTLEIENRFDFNVLYSDDNKKCKAVLNCEIRCKDNPDILHISAKNEGVFNCEGIEDEDDKKQAHVLAYTLLFPYVQNTISQLSVSAGLPPIMIEMAKIDPDTVKVK